MMRTVADASAAVDTEFVYDMCFPVMYPDRLGRTVLDAVDASLTGGFAQPHRAHKFVVGQRPSLLSLKQPYTHKAGSHRRTFMVIVVPCPTTVSICISSEYRFIFGRPSPAPNPSERTSSLAVEKPSCMA